MFFRELHYPILLILYTTTGKGFSLEDAHRLQMESQMKLGLKVEYKVFWLIPPPAESPNASLLVPRLGFTF